MYYAIDDVCEYFVDLLTTNAGSLGITQIFYGDLVKATSPNQIVVILPGPLVREGNAVQFQFKLTFTVYIYVLHARLSQSRTMRTRTDLQLARSIVQLVHQPTNRTLGGNIAGGYVASENPRSLPFSQGPAVISTELIWRGQTREQP